MDSQDLTGQLLGQYRIEAYLGGGGMGVVYRATDTRLQRPAAIKLLPRAMGTDPVARERLLREARSASVLDHPNICTIYEVNETDDGQIYVAMALYEGETIADLVGRGPVGMDQAIDLSLQTARGLAVAHERGIVHRDVKPANIFITSDGLVKLLDFGLAQLDEGLLLTREGDTIGTAAYMAPEQTLGASIDHRADVWALGVVLYEMLAGKRPFAGAYPQAVIYCILNTEPEPLGGLVAGLPIQCTNLVERALSKDAAGRHETMASFIEDLIALRDRREVQLEVQSLAPSPLQPVFTRSEGDDVLQILCVDDEPELELLMQQRFRKRIRAGEWEFTYALNGEEALAKLETRPDIGLVLTDLNMPRMDGLALLARLADMDRPIRTVVVSAYGDMEKIRTAMNRGAFDFITKPVDFKDLQATIEKARDDLSLFRDAAHAQAQLVSVKQEFEVARRLQEALQPGSFPASSLFDVYGFSAPAADVSGSFYDAFALDSGQIGILVGDAAGHGVSAALLMALGQTFARSFIDQGMSPADCLERIHTMPLSAGISNRALSIAAAVYNPHTGILDLCNAGGPPVLIRSAGGDIRTTPGSDTAVWSDGSAKEPLFEQHSINLEPGVVVVLPARGLLSAANPGGTPFSAERLATCVRESPESQPSRLIRHVIRTVYDHLGESEPREDLTLVALKRS